MRPIPLGYEARLDITVGNEMTVRFRDLGTVHPVYATYWMAAHMEEAGRKVILPFLEEGEEGIGSAVEVRHVSPAVVSMALTVTARHIGTEENRVTVACHVTSELGDLVGEGTTEQVVLPVESVSERFADLSRRLEASRRSG